MRILVVRDGGQAPCEHVTALLKERLVEVERRPAELTATRAMLQDLVRSACATDPATCTEGDICRIIATR
ncbi:MerR family DNA-binding protein [Kitasatospora sp. NPDC049285]|uniref:MerR family DNA-binding protein n=1 Tax=Kitasatospora sp. NPDC049285 TaxID=3157096 RepID=UPI00341520BE